MQSKAPEKRLDPSQIVFPLDQVTFGAMRRHSDQFILPLLDRTNAISIDLIAAHCFELDLAEQAFAKAAGLPDPSPLSNRSEDVSGLNDAYKRYGVSSGMQQTRQLIRELEHAASIQGRQSSSRSR